VSGHNPFTLREIRDRASDPQGAMKRPQGKPEALDHRGKETFCGGIQIQQPVEESGGEIGIAEPGKRRAAGGALARGADALMDDPRGFRVAPPFIQGTGGTETCRSARSPRSARERRKRACRDGTSLGKR